MRVGIVLVADAVDKRNIPGVHAEHVVELVDAELTSFAGFPVRGPEGGQFYIVLFEVCCYVCISENIKNVADMAAVDNPDACVVHCVPWGGVADGI